MLTTRDHVDTSALLRLALREPDELEDLRTATALVSSELLVVEAMRTLDRLSLAGRLAADLVSSRRALVIDWLEAVDLVLLRRPILARASEPFPTPLCTLDAIHLATLLVWREATGEQPVMATHDSNLGLAARAYGIEVHGT